MTEACVCDDSAAETGGVVPWEAAAGKCSAAFDLPP